MGKRNFERIASLMFKLSLKQSSVNSLTIANTNYVLSRIKTASDTKEILRRFRVLIKIVSLNDKIIDHVHAKKGEHESKAEFYIINGEISEIKIINILRARPLKGKDLKDFEVFLEKYTAKIVEKWISYFVYHKDVEFEE